MIFQQPQPIDTKATVDVATPESWRAALPGQDKVPVLRLCDDKGPSMPGWCTAGLELQGPELEVMCGGINSKQPTHAGLWRQGNLLHFGFEPRPGEFNATGRKLLVNAIAYIARFTTDRPIVKKPKGAGLVWLDFMLTSPKAKVEDLADTFAAPWHDQLAKMELEAARAFVKERRGALRVEGTRYTFDDDALALGVDVRKEGEVRQLAVFLRAEPPDEPTGALDRQRALRLLMRLLPDGPGADTTPNNWANWLQPRETALCFDAHSLVWRLDPLAHWRGVPSATLRGPQRADGEAKRDPAAAELAARVVAHHGGARALEDLHTLTCRSGDVRYLWDRRNGVFRAENRGTIPAGNRATAWQVAIFDTAADADVLRGGGPEPRPFVSARGSLLEVQERLLLPLLLLEPGTSLRLLPDDPEGRRCLEVRLAGRCADLRKRHVLHVDPQSGALHAIDVMSRDAARVVTWQVEGTIAVGPLQLPQKFVRTSTPRALAVEFADATWNPPVPSGTATSGEFLLGGQ